MTISVKTRIPVFTRFEIIHRSQLNMERNVYWTHFHLWFIDYLEEFLIATAPDLKERFNSDDLQILTLDTYIEHKLSAFLYETLCINLSIGEINIRESFVKILVSFTRGKDKVAEGWQRIKFVDREGKTVEIPNNIIGDREQLCVIDETLNDSVIDKGPSKELFMRQRKVYLSHTDRNGNTYPLVYLIWFAEIREDFLLHIANNFKERFSSGLRILTHDTYLKNYKNTASFNDIVAVDIRVDELRPASAKLLFTQTKEGKKLAEGWQTVVFADKEGKIMRIPKDILWNSRNYAIKGLNLLKLLGKIKE